MSNGAPLIICAASLPLDPVINSILIPGYDSLNDAASSSITLPRLEAMATRTGLRASVVPRVEFRIKAMLKTSAATTTHIIVFMTLPASLPVAGAGRMASFPRHLQFFEVPAMENNPQTFVNQTFHKHHFYAVLFHYSRRGTPRAACKQYAAIVKYSGQFHPPFGAASGRGRFSFFHEFAVPVFFPEYPQFPGLAQMLVYKNAFPACNRDIRPVICR